MTNGSGLKPYISPVYDRRALSYRSVLLAVMCVRFHFRSESSTRPALRSAKKKKKKISRSAKVERYPT